MKNHYQDYYGEECNSRAYLRNPVASFISKRFPLGSPVRMAIIPFSVPANLSAYNNELPGLGNKISWLLQTEILGTGEVPIVEVFNRQDWPGKKEEFHAGNHEALAKARAAGYDLVLVGVIENLKGLDSLTAHSKLIEVENGISLWNGRVQVDSNRDRLAHHRDFIGAERARPSDIFTEEILEELAACTAREILDPNAVPF
jgi:hypothetical protein